MLEVDRSMSEVDRSMSEVDRSMLALDRIAVAGGGLGVSIKPCLRRFHPPPGASSGGPRAAKASRPKARAGFLCSGGTSAACPFQPNRESARYDRRSRLKTNEKMTFRSFAEHARAIFPPRAPILPPETLASRGFPALQFSLPDFLKGIKTYELLYHQEKLHGSPSPIS